MNDQRSDKHTQAYWSWSDVELILYAIAGLFAIGSGVRALANWVVGEWAAGARLFPTLVLGSVAAAIATLLVVLRHRKRWLYINAALTIIGIVTFILVSAGVTIPPLWVD